MLLKTITCKNSELNYYFQVQIILFQIKVIKQRIPIKKFRVKIKKIRFKFIIIIIIYNEIQ
jgi:hypothetical protein